MATRDDAFKSEQFGKKLSRAQKIIIIGALIAAILVFVYSFIFMTPFSDLYQIDGAFSYQRMAQLGITKEYIESFQFPKEAYYYAPLHPEEGPIGLNLAYFTSFTRNELQVFNHWLFSFGFFALLVSLVPFIYFSQKRRIYYKTNIIVVPVVAAFNLYVGIHMFVQLVFNQIAILAKSQEYLLISAYQTYINDSSATKINEYFHVTDSNPMFVIGYIIAILVIAFAISSCILVALKYKYQKKQPSVDLSKVHINE